MGVIQALFISSLDYYTSGNMVDRAEENTLRSS